MIKIEIKHLKPANPRLNGATVGEAHALQIRQMADGARSEEVAVLDFNEIESATASYLKRIFNPFFASLPDPDSFRREVSPVAINIHSEDLKEDILAYLIGVGRVLIQAKETNGEIQFQNLLGQIDGAAAETFEELRNLKRTTALELYEKFPNRTSNQTAWNNRLANLVEMRIARRGRDGRNWIYQPTVTN